MVTTKFDIKNWESLTVIKTFLSTLTNDVPFTRNKLFWKRLVVFILRLNTVVWAVHHPVRKNLGSILFHVCPAHLQIQQVCLLWWRIVRNVALIRIIPKFLIWNDQRFPPGTPMYADVLSVQAFSLAESYSQLRKWPLLVKFSDLKFCKEHVDWIKLILAYQSCGRKTDTVDVSMFYLLFLSGQNLGETDLHFGRTNKGKRMPSNDTCNSLWHLRAILIAVVFSWTKTFHLPIYFPTRYSSENYLNTRTCYTVKPRTTMLLDRFVRSIWIV